MQQPPGGARLDWGKNEVFVGWRSTQNINKNDGANKQIRISQKVHVKWEEGGAQSEEEEAQTRPESQRVSWAVQILNSLINKIMSVVFSLYKI